MAEASKGKAENEWRERLRDFERGLLSWLITLFFLHLAWREIEKHIPKGVNFPWIRNHLPAGNALDRHVLVGKHRKRCDVVRKQLVFGVLLLFLFDPFELQESTLGTSDIVAGRLNAALYTAPAADRIAVVLVDDAALGHRTWPPDFTFWTDLTWMVMQQRPAAVYFDISFDNPRVSFSKPEDGSTAPDNVRADQEAAMFASVIAGGTVNGRVPVVLGSVGKQAALRSALAGCSSPSRDGEWTSVIPVLACAAVETDFYDFLKPPDGQGYPLWTAWKRPGGGYAVSRLPAVALAALSCKVLRPAPGWCATRGVGWLSMPGMMSRPDNVAVVPQWSLYTSDEAWPLNAVSMNACKRYRSRWWGNQLFLSSKIFLSEALAGPITRWLLGPQIQNRAGTVAEACMPFPVVSAAVLLNHSGRYSEALSALLHNRIVLIGDGRRYSSDYVPAPLHQNLPGVMKQATVLETLLDEGGNPPLISNKIRAWDNDLELIMKMFILLLAIAMDQIAEDERAKKDEEPQKSSAGTVTWLAHLKQSLARMRNSKAAGFYRKNVWNIPFTMTAFFVLLASLLAPCKPANWVFLVTEILLLSLGLGDLEWSRGKEKEDKREQTEEVEAAASCVADHTTKISA